MQFKIEKKGPGLARAGKIVTPHGVINTPAFVVVGTKATVKSVSPEQVKDLGTQVVLSNTYHLYLQPGDELIKKAGGLGKFMNWNGPTMTDSGGFQVFSLGVAFGKNVSKFAAENSGRDTCELLASSEPVSRRVKKEEFASSLEECPSAKLVKIDNDGVTFRSHLDGSEHRFTPERSIQIQHNIGADIIFAFDECTSPLASHGYQEEAMGRTHRWAERSLNEHKKLSGDQALFGIVQGGRFQDLREESARTISKMDFDGFGIGGSFEKKDLDTAVGWVCKILPEEKPRHLLGIGEPEDFFAGIENGIDTFDCVIPTRLGRNGTLMTSSGKLHITNAQFREDFSPIEEGCKCHTCQHYTKAYIAHLFRGNEMLAGTLSSVHNLHFSVNLVQKIREAILDDNLPEFKKQFMAGYLK